MVAVSTGELSPIVTGMLYCSVIEGCQQAYELRRAREWTAALSRWVEEQPQMVSFTGRCLVHRAEIMQVDGAWPEALQEARRARDRYAQDQNRVATGEAVYRQGEIHRLRGERAAAEQAYREASRCGWEPQPGLALLRLGQGDNEAAVATIRRVVDETTEPMRRAGLLPAYIEIMLAVGDLEGARGARRELEEITAEYRGGTLGATVAHARGAVALAEGDATGALAALREASQLWQDIGAPYDPRASVSWSDLPAGSSETWTLRRWSWRRRAVCSRSSALRRTSHESRSSLITLREGRGRADRARGRDRPVGRDRQDQPRNRRRLVISEKTVARHVSNVFTKLGVSSRSAVTAYAYEHDLV